MTDSQERLRTIYTAEQIDADIARLVEKIFQFYGDKEITPLVILQGASRFFDDFMAACDTLAALYKEKGLLVPKFTEPIKLHVSSYGSGTASNRQPRLVNGSVFDSKDVAGKNVLIFDDIVDGGDTIKFMLGLVQAAQPASVETAVLFAKPRRARKVDVPVRFIGRHMWFNRWIAGRGIDSQGKYRDRDDVVEVIKKDLHPWKWHLDILREKAEKTIRPALVSKREPVTEADERAA